MPRAVEVLVAKGVVLVDDDIRGLVARGDICALLPIGPSLVQPASLDLTLGARIWTTRCSFLPGSRRIEEYLDRISYGQPAMLSRDDGFVLHKGGVYVAEIEQSIVISDSISGKCSPKSSMGRLDVFVRVLTERGSEFDRIPPGYQGRLFVEIAPQSFPIVVRRTDAVTQLRFEKCVNSDVAPPDTVRTRLADCRVRPEELLVRKYLSPNPTPDAVAACKGNLPMTVDLDNAHGHAVCWRSRLHTPPVDLQGRHFVDDFWERIEPRGGSLILEADRFYVLATKERVSMPRTRCGELVAFDPTKGEVRTHYAGFVDPGFGMSVDDKPIGAPLVVEMRPRDVPFLIEDGQPLFTLEVLATKSASKGYYGTLGNNYQMQGLKLAKQFP